MHHVQGSISHVALYVTDETAGEGVRGREAWRVSYLSFCEYVNISIETLRYAI
jgi:hypothetical protein